MEQKEFKRVGGAWKKQDKNGKTFLSMSLEIDGKKRSFTVTQTKEKKTDKSPDYNVSEILSVTSLPKINLDPMEEF